MKPDLDPYSRWQQNKYGDILPPAYTPITDENSTEEERRFSEWMQHEAEQQMLQVEEYFGCKNDINL